MATQSTCRKCSAPLTADAQQGFCPKCLFLQASAVLPEDSEQKSSAGGGPSDAGAAANADGQSPIAKGAADDSELLNRKSQIVDSLGDYELLEEIGRGGMGVVYRARQRSLDRVVAIKLMAFGPGASPEFIKRFRAEAVSAASLHHPNIVAIHEVGIHQGQHFFVMDYIEGRSLARLVGHEPLPARRAAGYLKTVAEAVHYAHERSILHRDLKPSNVLIDAEDQPHVVDFGLARRLDGDSELTVTGQVLGSPNYLPPEQATGQRARVSRRTDVYALGATLYHLLTGRPPFQAESLAQTLDLVLHAEPVPPRLLNPGVPRDLETICLKCLEKEPARRYPTAQALADELGRFLASEPIQARPLGPAGKVWRWCRRKPQVASLAALAMLTFLLGFAGVVWEWRHSAWHRRRAEAGELSARENAYAADMKELQRALEDSDLGRARELLNRYRPALSAPSTLNPQVSTDLRGWEWRYFWSRCRSDESFTLCRYSNCIANLAFSSDGRWLVVRRDRDNLAVWDAVAQRPSFELPGDWEKSLAFAPRGNLLAWGRTDKKGVPMLYVLDLDSRKEIASLALRAAARSVAFSPDAKLVAALCEDGSVWVCDVASQQVVSQFAIGSLDRRRSALTASRATGSSPGEPLEITSAVGGLPTRRTLSRGEGNATRQNGSARVGTELGPASNLFVQHYGCVQFSPDGRWLAVGEVKPRIRLVDRATGNTNVIELPPPADGITALAVSRDGRLLAAGCGVLDHDVHIWELAKGTEADPGTSRPRPLMRLVGHSGWIAALAFSPDGQTLASAGADQTIRLWDVSPRETGPKSGPTDAQVISRGERRRFQGSAGQVWALAWSPDGKRLVSGDGDGAVRYWDPAAKPSAASHLTLPALTFVAGLTFLPESKSFLTATQPDGSIVRWNTATLQVMERLAFLGTNHNSLALSKDGHWLALGDADGHVQVWDWPARQLITNLVFDGVIAGFLLSPRGQMLACGGLQSRDRVGLKFWKMPGWEAIDLRGLDLRWADIPALSSDDRMIAVGYFGGPFGGKAVWWDLADGTKVASFDCPAARGAAVKVAFSPDGKLFATAAIHEGVTLWDMATRQPRSIGRAFRDLLYWVEFSQDGRRLIASGTSPEAVVRLWDVQTGRELAALPGEPGSYRIGFSPDGNTLWASGNEGRALFWRAPSFAEIEAAEKGNETP